MSLRRWLRFSIFLASLLVSTAAAQALFVQEARAARTAKPKVAVGGFSGDKNGEVRDAFLAALREDGSYDITDAEDVKSTASIRAVADAASAMEVNAVITGKLVGSSLKLKIMGADGRQLATTELKGAGRAKLKASIKKSAASSVEDGVDRAFAAERAKAEKAKKERAKRTKAGGKKTPPEDSADADDSADDSDNEDPDAQADTDTDADAKDEPEGDQGPGLSPFDLTAGLRGMRRTFAFHNTLAELRPNDGFGKFLTYKLPLGPAVFADLNWYPGTHFAKGQAERIGLTAGYEIGFAITTVYAPEGAAKQSLTTKAQAFYVGARYRLPLAVHELGAAATMGQHTFTLSGDEAAPLVPDVKYTYFKLGLDGSLRFGPVSIAARVGKRFVFDTGPLKSVWFPAAVTTRSLEAGATLGYRVFPALEVVAGFDWLRYAFDFNPVRRRAGFESAVAGGAVDQYFYGSLGVRVRLPGDGEQASSAPNKAPATPTKDEDDEE